MRGKIFKLMSVSILALTLTACSNSSANEKKDKANDEEKITVMAPYYSSEPPTKNNEVETKLEKMLGKKLDISWVPDASYEDKLNVTMASGELPEMLVFQSKSPAFVKSAEAGAFWDLTKYFNDDEYPFLKNAHKEVLENSGVNGKIYGVYQYRDIMSASITLRKDWLEKLGLKSPEKVQDIYTIAKAFTEEDPDGNGKADTTGIAMDKVGLLNNGSMYDLIATWMGAPNGWGEDKDGNLTPAFKSPAYFESMKFVKKIVDNGYINKDYATTTDKPEDRLIQGKSGMIITFSYHGNPICQKIGADKTLKQITFTGNIKNDNGGKSSYAKEGYGGLVAIPKSSVKTEKELRTILKWINDSCAEEPQHLMGNGLENVNYKKDGRFATTLNSENKRNKEIVNDVQGLSMVGTYVSGDYGLKMLADPKIKDEMDRELDIKNEDLKTAVYNAAAPYVSKTYSAKGATLDKIILDARLKYIAGQIDEKGWNDAIKLWDKSGGNDVTKELSKLNKENRDE